MVFLEQVMYYTNVRSQVSLSFLLFKCFKTQTCGKFNSSLQMNVCFPFLSPSLSHFLKKVSFLKDNEAVAA